MVGLVLESWLLLFYFELVMVFRGFRVLHQLVGTAKCVTHSGTPQAQNRLCHAMDLANVLYFKRVLCLQRSAATTLLLRRHGWRAEMVIGAQMIPFKSHAWVEVDRIVVNDKPHVLDIYRVLERC